MSVLHFSNDLLFVGNVQGDLIVFKVTETTSISSASPPLSSRCEPSVAQDQRQSTPVAYQKSYKYSFVANAHCGSHPIVSLHTSPPKGGQCYLPDSPLLSPTTMSILVVCGESYERTGSSQLCLFELMLSPPASLCSTPLSSYSTSSISSSKPYPQRISVVSSSSAHYLPLHNWRCPLSSCSTFLKSKCVGFFCVLKQLKIDLNVLYLFVNIDQNYVLHWDLITLFVYVYVCVCVGVWMSLLCACAIQIIVLSLSLLLSWCNMVLKELLIVIASMSIYCLKQLLLNHLIVYTIVLNVHCMINTLLCTVWYTSANLAQMTKECGAHEYWNPLSAMGRMVEPQSTIQWHQMHSTLHKCSIMLNTALPMLFIQPVSSTVSLCLTHTHTHM